jgi:hypothetical protein
VKGVNTFILNTATCIEAIQEYLDKRMPNDKVTVTGFVATSGTDTGFRVTTSSPPEARK